MSDEIQDALDLSLDSGRWRVNQNTSNIPVKTYGELVISKNHDGNWRFAVYKSSDTKGVYINFYNGYGDIKGWNGWSKIMTEPVD